MTSRDVKYCSNCRTIGTTTHCAECGLLLWSVCVRNCPPLVSLDDLARRAQDVVDGFARDLRRWLGE